MNEHLKFMVAMAVPTLTVLAGILINNARLSDLRADLNLRFASLEKLFDAKLLRMEQVMDARLKHIEEELERHR